MPNKVHEDWQEFIAGKDERVPTQVHTKLLHHIRAELQPGVVLVFVKLLLMQASTGVLTLLYCPQFELSLTGNIEMLHYFHHNYGMNVCALVCGAIFTAPGAVLAAYLLKTAEINRIRNAGMLYHLGIAAVALLAFCICGADVYNQLALFWLTAAALTATLLFDLNFWLRPRLLRGLLQC